MVQAFLVYFVNLKAGPLPQLTGQVVWLPALAITGASLAASLADHHPGLGIQLAFTVWVFTAMANVASLMLDPLIGTEHGSLAS